MVAITFSDYFLTFCFDGSPLFCFLLKKVDKFNEFLPIFQGICNVFVYIGVKISFVCTIIFRTASWILLLVFYFFYQFIECSRGQFS